MAIITQLIQQNKYIITNGGKIFQNLNGQLSYLTNYTFSCIASLTDGNNLYVIGGDDTTKLKIYDLSTMILSAVISIPFGCNAMMFDPDKNVLVLHNVSANTGACVFDISTFVFTTTFSLPSKGQFSVGTFIYNPDTKKYILGRLDSGGNNVFYVYNSNSFLLENTYSYKISVGGGPKLVFDYDTVLKRYIVISPYTISGITKGQWYTLDAQFNLLETQLVNGYGGFSTNSTMHINNKLGIVIVFRDNIGSLVAFSLSNILSEVKQCEPIAPAGNGNIYKYYNFSYLADKNLLYLSTYNQIYVYKIS